MPSSAPAGVSTALRPVLDGPVRPARVLGAFPTAVYLGVDGVGGVGGVVRGPVVAVITADALRLPCAAVLADSSRTHDLRTVAAPDATATVGGGRIHLPGLTVHTGRWWVPRTPRRWPAAPTSGAPADHDPDLAAALAAGDRARVERIALSLLGRGEGLTPEGDDVLAGVLVAAHALADDHPVAVTARVLAGAVRDDAHRRTTSLSADLLGHAAHGHGVPPLLDLVDALGGHGDLGAARARLLQVGHTSGAALARGTMTVARATALAGPVTPTYDLIRHRLEIAS